MLPAIFIIPIMFGFVVFFGAPYVPSKRRDIESAFDTLYHLGPDDTLVDIGSGDGVVLRAAARRGAKAVGYEINPLLVGISWLLSRGTPTVTTYLASFWGAELPSTTTVIYTFGDSRDIEKMRKKVEATATQLGRPIHFISYAFAVPGLTPVQQTNVHFLYLVHPLQGKKAQV